jgi:Serine carboxypeptidase S28
MFNLRGRGTLLVVACAALVFNVKPTAGGSCPIFPTFFFSQTLDHDLSSPSPSAGNGTFQQQYELNTTYFRPGGPILFIQSAESTILCVETTVFWDWAQEMGAMVASLEHCYFRLSVPAGFNASTATPSQYAYLTMNNTLLDSVNFVGWVKKTVLGAEDSKVIVMGGWYLHQAILHLLLTIITPGSYGGTLATLLRVHYLETFYGSIPLAPLLRSFRLDASNPDKYN